MARLNHAEYLASENWKVRRARSLYLAQNRCQSPTCTQSYLRSLTDLELLNEIAERLPSHAYRLEVHHLTYERLGAEWDDDLIVLCPACHRGQHGIPEPRATWSVSMADAVAGALLRLVPAAKPDKQSRAAPTLEQFRTVDEQLRELGFPLP